MIVGCCFCDQAIDFSSLTRRLAKLRTAVDDVLPSSGSDSDVDDEERRTRHRYRRSTRRGSLVDAAPRSSALTPTHYDVDDVEAEVERQRLQRLEKQMTRRPPSPRIIEAQRGTCLLCLSCLHAVHYVLRSPSAFCRGQQVQLWKSCFRRHLSKTIATIPLLP